MMDGWGEEVAPGIHIIRRGPSADRLLPSEIQQLSPLEASAMVEQIEQLIRRLTQSNEEMKIYLEEQEANGTPETDGVLEQAMKENEALIAQKRQEAQICRPRMPRECGSGAVNSMHNAQPTDGLPP